MGQINFQPISDTIENGRIITKWLFGPETAIGGRLAWDASRSDSLTAQHSQAILKTIVADGHSDNLPPSVFEAGREMIDRLPEDYRHSFMMSVMLREHPCFFPRLISQLHDLFINVVPWHRVVEEILRAKGQTIIDYARQVIGKPCSNEEALSYSPVALFAKPGLLDSYLPPLKVGEAYVFIDFADDDEPMTGEMDEWVDYQMVGMAINAPTGIVLANDPYQTLDGALADLIRWLAPAATQQHS
ncbi:MAG: hypothetical protein WC400_00970 [Patescibacteria group bacterium]